MKMYLSISIVILAVCFCSKIVSDDSIRSKDIDHTKKLVYRYPRKYHDYAKRKQKDTAVVIVGYNRPHYFKRVLNALVANKRARTLPFFFILDGGSGATQSAYRALIKECPLKNKHIIARPFNYGLHWNVLSGQRFMFEWCGFNRVIHFEDDVVVTPTYLDLVLQLDDWASKKYDNIGAVQAYTPCRMTLEEKKAKRAMVGETGGFWLGYCMHRKVWNAIKDIVYEYEHEFLRRKRFDSHGAKQWMSKKVAEGRTFKARVAGKERWQIPLASYYSKLPEMGVGQCGILTMSLFLRGYSRLTTLVSRGLNIGAQGANFTPEHFERRFKGITLEHFPEDAFLKEFVSYDRFVY